MKTAYEIETEIATARAAAIARIEAIMLPGAEALSSTRTTRSDYWIDREVKAHGAWLLWRSQGAMRGDGSTDPGKTQRSSAQVVVPADIAPEAMVEIARIAAIETDRIARECRETLTAASAAGEITRAAWDAVAAS